MNRMYWMLVFTVCSLAGLGMILYGALGKTFNRKPVAAQDDVIGFDEPAVDVGAGLLDTDTGHEGLKHREKEPFDPDKHKPEPI